MCGGIKARTSNPVFNALRHSKQHEGGKRCMASLKSQFVRNVTGANIKIEKRVTVITGWDQENNAVAL